MVGSCVIDRQCSASGHRADSSPGHRRSAAITSSSSHFARWRCREVGGMVAAGGGAVAELEVGTARDDAPRRPKRDSSRRARRRRDSRRPFATDAGDLGERPDRSRPPRMLLGMIREGPNGRLRFRRLAAPRRSARRSRKERRQGDQGEDEEEAHPGEWLLDAKRGAGRTAREEADGSSRSSLPRPATGRLVRR